MNSNFEIFELEIKGANEVLKETFSLDSGLTKVTGIAVLADQDKVVYARTRIGLLVGGQEIFPDAYQAKLLMSGLAVPPNQRYYPSEVSPGNFEAKVTITDVDHAVTAFTPYKVFVYLQWEDTV